MMKIKNEYNKSIDLIEQINQLIRQSKINISETNNIVIGMDDRTERIIKQYDKKGRFIKNKISNR
jgi:hypothetical protein